MQLLRVACVLSAVQAFVAPHARQPRHAMRGAPEDAADAKIDSFVKDNKVMLFMKGTKIFPQCGFSNMAVQILNAIGADFETCDVLSDDFIRQQIKVYSDWPTIPQLYVDGEFVGGSDIMLEMYQAGELQEMIEVAAAS
jgi:monothiol glutaredoxin